MLRASIYFELDRECILSEITAETENVFDITHEEVLDNHLITFLLDSGDHESMAGKLRASDQVKSVESIDDRRLLVTKRSCGALPIIRSNHGKLAGIDRVSGRNRIFDVLVFRREDLKHIIEELDTLGSVTLGSLSRPGQPADQLSSRQAEVIEMALDEGFFDWPRGIAAEELANRLDIAHPTMLEHLRKAEKKLLLHALAGGSETASTPDDRGFILNGHTSTG